MALTNFPNGVSSMGVPVLGGQVPTTTGNYWFVDSAGTVGDGTQSTSPFLTIAAAVSAATANNGDIVVVAARHAETISGAAGIAFSKAGLTFFFCGEGANRPTFTLGTSTAATITVTGASTKWTGAKPIIVCALDSIVSCIVVSAANCTLSYEHQDTSATVEAVTSLLTTAAADNLTVDLKYIGFPAGNACVAPIQLVGCNNAVINLDFYGLASTSVVNFITPASSNIEVYGYAYNATDTTGAKLVVDTVGGSTWFANLYAGAAGAQFSGGSGAAIATDDVQALLAVPTADATTNVYERDVIGIKTDAAVTAVGTTKSITAYAKGLVTMNTVQSADATNNAFAGDVVGNKTDAAVTEVGTTKSLAAYAKGLVGQMWASPICVEKADGAVLSGDDPIFTISGGPVRILSITGIVTTQIGAGTTNVKLELDTTTPSATVQMNAGAVDIDADAAGTSYRSINTTGIFTPITAGFVLIANAFAVLDTEYLAPIGTIQFNSDAARAGNIKWYLSYIPLSPNSRVTAAA